MKGLNMIELERKRDRHGDGRKDSLRHHRHHSEGGHHSEGARHGGGRKKKKGLSSLLEGKVNAMLLFVGAVNCARHRADQMGDLMREGRLAMLCPTAADYATGRYLHQIVDAMLELSQSTGVNTSLSRTFIRSRMVRAMRLRPTPN